MLFYFDMDFVKVEQLFVVLLYSNLSIHLIVNENDFNKKYNEKYNKN